MRALRISSCMAPNMEVMVAGVADWLAFWLDQPVEVDSEPTWQQREHLFDQGKIDLIWICGLPYTWKADDTHQSIHLVAAPVMAGSRYQNEAIYYSDVVVSTRSPFNSFEELAQSRWAINEPNSHSGFGLTRYFLAKRGLDWGYFQSVKVAGSHQAAIAALLEGEVEAAAIDSTVLEQAIRSDPKLKDRLRVIKTLGPSPSPPWVARDGLDKIMFSRIQQALISMHRQAAGRRVLALAGISHLVEVEDADYDPIRQMEQTGRKVQGFEGLGG